MSDADKRRIAGEPSEFDDFANSWYDDIDCGDGEYVEENPKAKFFPLPDAKTFAQEICAARSLRTARNSVERWLAIVRGRGAQERSKTAGSTTLIGGFTNTLRAIDAMREGKLRPHFERGTGSDHPDKIRYVWPIFTCGNMKLPFWTWSKLPVYTCPGRGECEQYCYSLSHLVHPAALCTLIQNTLLIHLAPHVIAEAFSLLPDASVLRLHVDGDFESAAEIAMWQELLAARPPRYDRHKLVGGIASYAYTKSWDEVLEYEKNDGRWADNFWLNISSGGKHDNDAAKKRRLLKVPAVRGEFVVVHDDRMPCRLPGVKLTKEEKKQLANARFQLLKQDLKQMYPGRRTWPCVGKCADCACYERPGGKVCRHACGHEAFKGVLIGIARHGYVGGRRRG